MEIPASELSPHEAYGLLTSVIVPRAIAWTSTVSLAGRRNLAPFSYFTGVSSDPPMIVIGIGNRPDGRPKDTYQNAQETGVFCVNLVEENFAIPMNVTSGSFEPGVDEFEQSGLVAEPCKAIDCVRVKGARAVLECKLAGSHTYGRSQKVHLTVGEVVHAYLADDLVTPGKKRADPNQIKAVARLGGSSYAKLGERFQLVRPKI